MDSIKVFHKITQNPGEYILDWKEKTGRKVIGTFCSYSPDELITASGSLGYRIFGTGSSVSKADKFLQSYSCSLVRGALEEKLSGGLEFIDGVVFPHTCDSIQRLSDIWRMNIKDSFHLDLVMPVKLNTESARIYMAEVLKTFKTDLEQQLSIQISDQALEEAIDLCNQIRRTMGEIYNFRLTNPGVLKGTDLHAMVKAGMIMDRSEYFALIKKVLEELKTSNENTDFSGKKLVLSGGLCNMPDVYDVIENAGAYIVKDDLCTGNRFFQQMVEKSENLVEAIADRYTNRLICPAKHSGIRSRGEALIKMVEESNAEGVLFIYLKFCDPHGFDYPYLKEMLDEKGIPSFLYEIEDQLAAAGQFQTRCEAFVEML